MIKEGQIYTHLKTGNFYKILMIASHNDRISNKLEDNDIVIYQRCDINGIFISLRDHKKNIVARQPFYRDIIDFKRKFKRL